MYYYLVGALKRRLISELRDSFSRHPLYRKIVPFIQNRFSFQERPQFGIVIQSTGANKVQLAGDNFVGTITSHVMLAYVGQPTYPIEWVKEDLNVVRVSGMLTLPGVYYIEILSAPTNPEEDGMFVIDPLLTVNDEPVLLMASGIETEAQLQQVPVQNTLRLWENRRTLLTEGQHYEVDWTTGAVTFTSRFPANTRISADYRYAATSVGPIPFKWNSANHTALPGVVLAFGKRAEAGNKVAVVVYEDRVDVAQAYGGKFELNFDLQVIARDTTQMEEIADLLVMYLWGEKKASLEFEGIEIVDISIGGESEEIADETGDSFFYQANLSLSMRADWEAVVPLPLTISKVSATSGTSSTIQPVTDGLFFQTHPIFAGRNSDYERIG